MNGEECEKQEVDQHDVLLIKEEGGNKELKKKTLFDQIPWIFVAVGSIIMLTDVSLKILS